MDFTLHSARSRYASDRRFAMQIASGQCTGRGTMFIRWMQRLGNGGQHINVRATHYYDCRMTPITLKASWTLQMKI